MGKDKEYALTLDEAITIVEAHMNKQWESMYLQEAWETIKKELGKRNEK